MAKKAPEPKNTEPLEEIVEEPTAKTLVVQEGSQLHRIVEYDKNIVEQQEQRENIFETIEDLTDTGDTINHPYARKKGYALMLRGVLKGDLTQARVGLSKMRGKAPNPKDIMKKSLEELNKNLQGLRDRAEEAEDDYEELYIKHDKLIDERTVLHKNIIAREEEIQSLNCVLEDLRIQKEAAEKKEPNSIRALDIAKEMHEKTREGDLLQRQQMNDNVRAKLKHDETEDLGISQKELAALLPHVENHIITLEHQINQYDSHLESNSAAIDLTLKIAESTKDLDKARELINQFERKKAAFAEKINIISDYNVQTPLIDVQTRAKKIKSIGIMTNTYKESYKAIEGYDPSNIENMHVNEAYNIMGLEFGASEEELKSRRRTLAMKYHPDKASKNGLSKEEAEKGMITLETATELIKHNEELANKDYKIAFGANNKKKALSGKKKSRK